MSKHITGDEMKQYFDIICAKSPEGEYADFVDEIDSHVAECDCCFEKMRAVRLLRQGFSAQPDLAAAFVRAEFPESLAHPPFDIAKVFQGVRLVRAELEGRIQMLADTLSGRMNAAFSSCGPVFAAARGAQDCSADDGAVNDLMRSDMEFALSGGRRITLRCRNTGGPEAVRLLVCSNFMAEFLLTSDGTEIRPLQRDYDAAAEEYVWVYELDGGEFILRAG